VKSFDDYVSDLGIKHRSKQAFWHLVLSGAPALPAVRRGLQSEDAAIRNGCARVLDHLVDDDSYPDLIALLSDDSAEVRVNALHALACDRCKDNECRPPKRDIFEHGLAMMRDDPDRHVRAMAIEIVGRFVHEDPVAEQALIAAHDGDADPTVRKMAGWFAPGGPRWEKTRPRVTR
jgi:HEAT repeat protein